MTTHVLTPANTRATITITTASGMIEQTERLAINLLDVVGIDIPKTSPVEAGGPGAWRVHLHAKHALVSLRFGAKDDVDPTFDDLTARWSRARAESEALRAR